MLKLNKSLYGLKQGSYYWFQKLKKALIDRNFVPSAVNSCIYFAENTIAIVHVDDVIIVAMNKLKLDSIVKSLFDTEEKFNLTD